MTFRDLVAKFALLRNAPQDKPEALYQWACEQLHASTRLAAQFVLTCWDPKFIEQEDAAQRPYDRLGPFDVFEAKTHWDSQGISVLRQWLAGALTVTSQSRPVPTAADGARTGDDDATDSDVGLRPGQNTSGRDDRSREAVLRSEVERREGTRVSEPGRDAAVGTVLQEVQAQGRGTHEGGAFPTGPAKAPVLDVTVDVMTGEHLVEIDAGAGPYTLLTLADSDWLRGKYSAIKQAGTLLDELRRQLNHHESKTLGMLSDEWVTRIVEWIPREAKRVVVAMSRKHKDNGDLGWTVAANLRARGADVTASVFRLRDRPREVAVLSDVETDPREIETADVVLAVSPTEARVLKNLFEPHGVLLRRHFCAR